MHMHMQGLSGKVDDDRKAFRGLLLSLLLYRARSLSLGSHFRRRAMPTSVLVTSTMLFLIEPIRTVLGLFRSAT